MSFQQVTGTRKIDLMHVLFDQSSEQISNMMFPFFEGIVLPRCMTEPTRKSIDDNKVFVFDDFYEVQFQLTTGERSRNIRGQPDTSHYHWS